MDIQNDGLEKVDSFKVWPFLVSVLDFWGVDYWLRLVVLAGGLG